MAKKSFKNNPALAFIESSQESTEMQETYRTHNTQKAHKTHSIQTDDTPKFYRFNLKLRPEYKEYLDEMAWKNRKTITEYLNDLVEADKVKQNIN